jgi:predicted dienelactone hydrolase
MIRRFAVIAGIALTVACASSSPNPRQQNVADPREKDPTFRYGRNPGPSPVGAIPDIVVNDATRPNRAVKMSIDYPTRTGPHPLIVFSHGGGGSNRGYPGLAAHWASYGYVVIRPAHNDTAAADQITVADWRNRARDISLVIDSLDRLERDYPELQGKIDRDRIGVAGHARGAMTAMMVGGLRTFPGPESFADPRVKAIAALSPAGPRQVWGVTNESFATINIPALFMTGSRDAGTNEEETPAWRQQAYELSPAGDKWFVSVEGVAPGTFAGDVSPSGEPRMSVPMNPRNDPTILDPQQAERQRMARAQLSGINERALFAGVRALALAFFDTYLKTGTNGRQFLEESDARANVVVLRK